MQKNINLLIATKMAKMGSRDCSAVKVILALAEDLDSVPIPTAEGPPPLIALAPGAFSFSLASGGSSPHKHFYPPEH